MNKFLSTLVTATLLAGMIWSGTLVFGQAVENGTSTGNASASAADALTPSDVTNLKATPGDSEVRLTWDAATDNVGVTGYRIYRGTTPVTSASEEYDLPYVPVGNVTTYTVKNLINGQPYYFSATALDAAGNESESYATEATATPKAGLRSASIEDDGKAPQVKNVDAEDVITVLVEFSEPVKLPEEQPASAFRIEKMVDKTRLTVQKAELDARDEKGKTVLLTTAPQTEDAKYLLTVGIEVEDYYGNPIASGTADSGSFDGSKKQHAGTGGGSGGTDTEAPVAVSGSADFSNRMSVTFSEKVVLPENPKSKVTVVKKGTTQALKVVNVTLSVDGKTVFIATDPQAPVSYEVKIAGIKDTAGNEVALAVVSVSGKGSGIADLIPPEDVTQLIAKIKDAEKNLVELKWKPSKNSAKDLADQLLYQSADRSGKAYGNGTSLGANATVVEVEDLSRGSWYTFKVTTKDESGNESKGAVRSVYLPETGPGILAAGITALAMGWYRRKKRLAR